MSCNGGIKTRSRNVIEEPNETGEKCELLEEAEVCKIEQCPGPLLQSRFSLPIGIFMFINVDLQFSAKLVTGKICALCSNLFQSNLNMSHAT